MNAAEARAAAKGLNDAQKTILTNALFEGEETRQREGKKRLSRKDCIVPTGYRSGNTTPSRRALERRGLVEQDRHHWRTILSTDGLKVARLLYVEYLAERAQYDDCDEDGNFLDTSSLEAHVASYIGRQKAEKDEHTSKLERAVDLWRGVTLADHWDEAKRRSVSKMIREEFEDDHLSYRRGINLDLDEMIDLGEQIEALR